MNPVSDPSDPVAVAAAHVSAPRPPKAWRILVFLLLLVTVAVAMLFVGRRYGDRIAKTMGQMWEDIAGAPPQDEGGGDGSFFTCGMHPWVILPTPGLCPICHMDLTPLDPSKFTGEITIDPVVVQNIGVRTAVVETGPLVRTVRTVGKVDYDETGLHDVNLRVGGWIEALHADFLGAPVAAGQPLFELYSPELYTAQQEYLLALGRSRETGVEFVPRVAEDAATALQAARTRLTYYGIDDAQIAALEQRGAPQKTMTIASPRDGTVVEKMAVDGMRVTPGMRMYRIADLRRVWVTVAVYEYQLPYVAAGQEAVMSLPYLPGHELRGAVTYVYPWTDEKTRQVNVRLEFDNPDGLLKPGMFAEVELRRTLAEAALLVPRTAVIDTGARQVAMVSLGEGRFEPRELQLGVETDGDRVEVRAGLAAGERVVTSAQFLLDSEARIREGLLRMLRGDLVAEADKPAGPELTSQPPALAGALSEALDAYLRIGEELAADSAAGVAAGANELAAALLAAAAVPVPGDEHFWHRHTEAATAAEQARALAGAADLAAARLVYYDLSVAFTGLLRATGVPAGRAEPVEELHCPMYEEHRGGAAWLQPAGAVRNPYYGSEMLVCFDWRKGMPVVDAAAVGERGR